MRETPSLVPFYFNNCLKFLSMMAEDNAIMDDENDSNE